MYCERDSAAFWAEPVNALTNVAFLVAAWAAWRLARRSSALSPGIWLLLATTVAIGVGSFAFHTFATGWVPLLDLVPIAVFQLLFLWLYARRVMQVSPAGTALIVAGFLALSYFARQVFQGMHISLYYVPPLLGLVALGVYHAVTATRGRFDLLAAAGVLTVSLAFRTIDGPVCAAFPLGTHFVWHLLNGLVLYLAMRGLFREAELREQPPVPVVGGTFQR